MFKIHKLNATLNKDHRTLAHSVKKSYAIAYWDEQHPQAYGDLRAHADTEVITRSVHSEEFFIFRRRVLLLQWCQIENQQTPIYVVNSDFSRYPDGCWECCCRLALLNHLYSLPYLYLRAFQWGTVWSCT